MFAIGSSIIKSGHLHPQGSEGSSIGKWLASLAERWLGKLFYGKTT
jgi:hypothetical protein